MSDPATDVQVHLELHHRHPSAITATLTGSAGHLARALLSTSGFRPTDSRTMLLVRIDHEEPHYADQAARALCQEGITVVIGPGLQEAIDTEWTWPNHPMHWLSRQEIREVSDEAQKIHDDIAAGRLTIHLHAHDGWTIVAVGTYRNGGSVYLHGEDHLRVVAFDYATPAEAIAEFERLHGDAVRHGPAPATDTEREAAQLLAATALIGAPSTPDAHDANPVPEEARRELVPVYAADPGDHEALLASFLDEEGEWEKYRTWDDNTTIANHESLTLRAEFVHDTGPRDTNWTVAAYESPVGERLWHATATRGTPVEVVRTLLDALAASPAGGVDSHGTVTEQTIAQATRPLTDDGWRPAVDGRRITWGAPNGAAAGVQFDAFAAQARGGTLPAWVIWGGNTVDHPTWSLYASTRTPADVLEALTFELSQGQGHRLPTADRRTAQLSTQPSTPASLPPRPATSPNRPR